jgi:hypothetical protein
VVNLLRKTPLLRIAACLKRADTTVKVAGPYNQISIACGVVRYAAWGTGALSKRAAAGTLAPGNWLNLGATSLKDLPEC